MQKGRLISGILHKSPILGRRLWLILMPAMLLPPIRNIPEIHGLELSRVRVEVRLHTEDMLPTIFHFNEPQSILYLFLLPSLFIGTLWHNYSEIYSLQVMPSTQSLFLFLTLLDCLLDQLPHLALLRQCLQGLDDQRHVVVLTSNVLLLYRYICTSLSLNLASSPTIKSSFYSNCIPISTSFPANLSGSFSDAGCALG